MRRSAWGSPASAKAEGLLDERGAWSELPRLAAMADIIVLACVQVLFALALFCMPNTYIQAHFGGS